MEKSKFLEEVRSELMILKLNATDEEKGNLNIVEFDRNSVDNCIYGQMTGWCDSDRAKELRAKRYYYVDSGATIGRYLKPHESSPFAEHNFDEGEGVFTSLEKFLFMIDKNKAGVLVAYLKGLHNDLPLESWV